MALGPNRARRLARSAGFAVAVGLVGAGAGCAAILGFEDTTLRAADAADVDGGDGSDLDGDARDASVPLLTVTPNRLVLRRGASASLEVRAPGAAPGTTLTASGLPAGVSSAPAILTADGAARLELTASPVAALGTATARVAASIAGAAPVDVPLLVADASGSVDNTFDQDGLVIDGSKGVAATFHALALAADGSIVAGGAGNGAGPAAGWMLRRYSASGAADAAFTAATATAPADGEVRAVAIDGAGRILAVGTSLAAPSPVAQLTVARFQPNGTLDATFAGGIVRLPPAESPQGSSGYGLAVQPDGSVVVVGARRGVGPQEIGIAARFKVDGTRDAAFNGGATLALPDTRLVGAALGAGGAVLLAGSTTTGAPPAYFVTQRTSTGAPDATFGTGGVQTFGPTFRANAAARLEDGSYVVVGDIRQGASGFTAGLVSSKGAPVFARTTSALTGAAYFGVAAHDEGRFVAAGHVAAANGEARVDRMFVDGGPDPSFSDAGTAVLEPGGVPNGFDVALHAVVVQKDGRILVGGNRSNAGAILYRVWP